MLALIVAVIGLGGIILPIIPGLTLQMIAIVFWALEESTTLGWTVAILALVAGTAATVLKYQRPGRRLRESGIPTWLLVMAVGAGVIGFFVIPVIGGPLAFVLTIYVFEARKRDGSAWESTKNALGALAQSIGIEFAGGVAIVLLLAAGVWLG